MKTRSFPSLLGLLGLPALLLASPSTDRKIEEAARASYNYRAVLENHVNVAAAEGVVTLTGSVQDADHKSLAADTVENLPGVTGVRNEIAIKSLHPDRSDGWIAIKIRSLLLVRAHVSSGDTMVTVKDGAVTLGGSANNLAQKELTGVYAGEIDGVRSVRNDIFVRKVPAPAATVAEQIDDVSITTQVKYALLRHRSTSALNTRIATADGIVRVTGLAASEAEKALVTKLAHDVRGTKSVNNEMIVKN